MWNTEANTPSTGSAYDQQNTIEVPRHVSKHSALVARQNLSLTASATAINATQDALKRWPLLLCYGNTNASLIAAHTFLNELGATSDTRATIVGGSRE